MEDGKSARGSDHFGLSQRPATAVGTTLVDQVPNSDSEYVRQGWDSECPAYAEHIAREYHSDERINNMSLFYTQPSFCTAFFPPYLFLFGLPIFSDY